MFKEEQWLRRLEAARVAHVGSAVVVFEGLSLPETQKRLTDCGESADSRFNERSVPIDLLSSANWAGV
jgi:hypothetical protein